MADESDELQQFLTNNSAPPPSTGELNQLN